MTKRLTLRAKQVGPLTLAVGCLLSLHSPTAEAQSPWPPSALQYPVALEFKTAPPRAVPRPGSSCEVADQYVRLVAAKRPATGVPECSGDPPRPQQGRANASGAPMTLTALDFIEIEQLVKRYARAIVHCTNSGYDYADLYAVDGWFAPSRDGKVGQKWQGRERLADAAGGGKGGCRSEAPREITHMPTNHVIIPTPEGARGSVDLVAVGVGGDPFKVERQGRYEDTYVKTPGGWRFQSRTHVLRPGQTVTPLSQPPR